ncbi:hypothetical protein V8F63_02610 [Brevundimonas sp. LF-1]|uniref:hypothetical protein n=1 Tax=Brevundimonas sp. LF-1 TaxID=3126100 RepID=UPI0030E2FDA3
MTRKAVLDVGALFEEHWTGIPNVVAALVRHALDDQSIDWVFTHETVPLPRELVVKFLRQRSGAGGLDALSQLVWDVPPIAQADAAEMVAIFPNIKPVRRYFGKEAAIIHDLSPIVTPQFHNADNIFHFANRIRADVETSDHLFCVSRATLTDVEAYFGKPASEMSVIRLGCEFEPNELSAGACSCAPNCRLSPMSSSSALSSRARTAA